MAKYSKKEQRKVFDGIDNFHQEKINNGSGGRGSQIISRKQAIANGLSDALDEDSIISLKRSKSKYYAR